MVGLVEPVVGGEPVLLALECGHAAEGGVGVELAVCADHVLAFGDSVDIVAKTHARAVDKVLVGPDVSLSGVVFDEAVVAVVEAAQVRVVVERLVVHFIVGGGILHELVVLSGAHVGTPLGVYRNLSLAVVATLLGCNHNYTVGTARTVEGVGGGVFEDGHRLDILGGDVVHIAGVGHAVDHDEGGVAGVKRRYTADENRGVGLTGLSGSVVELYTGNFTGEGVESVRHLSLLDFG